MPSGPRTGIHFLLPRGTFSEGPSGAAPWTRTASDMTSPRKKTLAAVAILIALLVAGGATFLILTSRAGEDVLAVSRGLVKGNDSKGFRIPGADGGPLFRYGNPYLDGRSAWMASLFRKERETARTIPAPAEPLVESRVHRSPFSDGPWLAGLTPELARLRQETESQTVESRLTFLVPHGEPRALLRYLVGSNYLARIPGEGTLERELSFPPLKEEPEGLRSVPSLAANEWISRTRASFPLALPTDVIYIHSVFRDGELMVLVIEAWENVPGEGNAPIRLASTQFALVLCPGGALVRMLGYYSGQSIPPLLDGFVVRLTEAHLRKVASLVAQEAPSWTPAPDLAVHLDDLGI